MPTNLTENVLVIFCKDIILSYPFLYMFVSVKKRIFNSFSNNFVIWKYLSLYTVFWAGILELTTLFSYTWRMFMQSLCS